MRRTPSLRMQFMVSCAAVLQMTTAVTARAELLPRESLSDGLVHVVGLYSPQDQNKDDRVKVRVEGKGEPVILVLTGYFGAQWHLDVRPGTEVRQVIVAGYYEHSVLGVPEETPVEMITYFPKGDRSREDYFWAYSWHTKEGRALRSRLMAMTGKDVETFQGEYSARNFVVDGRRGKLDAEDLKHPPATQLVSKPEGGKKPAPDAEAYQAMHQQARLKHEVLKRNFGAGHPAVRQIEATMAMIRRELERLGKDLETIEESTANGDEVPKIKQDPREVIEQLVKQSFDLETELQRARVAKAEADLKRIKLQLQQREAAAERIIAARVDTLVQQSKEMTAAKNEEEESGEVSATLLASEGWAAWRGRDLRTALKRFEAALKKEPDNDAALNGIGWTYVHLQQYDKAISQFRRLLKDQPTHPGAMNGLGQSLLAQGKLDEAEDELLKATEDAIAALGEARAVQRGVTASWIGLIRTYLEQEDVESARLWIERYLKHQPDNQILLRLKADADSLEAGSLENESKDLQSAEK